MNHALRQRRYRARLQEKVTHQGSKAAAEDGLLRSVENNTENSVVKHRGEPMKCSFCLNTVTPWLRNGFLAHHSFKKIPILPYQRPP